jgi:hypothetical protein
VAKGIQEQRAKVLIDADILHVEAAAKTSFGGAISH